MEKETIEPRAIMFPMPAVLVGSKGKDNKTNFAAIAWAGVVNSEPPMIGVGVRRSRFTHGLISESSEFSVNVPSKDQAAETDYCGMTTGSKVHKAADCKFTVFFGKLKNAPLIKECPLNIECKVEKVINLPSHDYFIGRIIGMHVDRDIHIRRGKENITIEPLVFMGTHYAEVSGFLGKAYSVGKTISKKGFG